MHGSMNVKFSQATPLAISKEKCALFWSPSNVN